MDIEILRTYHADGVNGDLHINGEFFCHTIELPWKENHYQVSCIPEGKYRLRKRETPHFGLHCWVENVPGRDAILIHAFNHALKESRGCIAPVATLTGNGRGSTSRETLKKLMQRVVAALQQKQTVFLIIKKANHANTN